MSADDRMDHVDDLLPSYVAGTLDDADRRDVLRHLEVCPHCRTRLAAWRAVAGALREMDDAVPEPSPLVLARALATVDGLEARRAAPLSRTTMRTRMRSAIHLLREQGGVVPRTLWIAVAAAMLVTAVAACLAPTTLGGGRILSYTAPLVSAVAVAGLVRPASRTRAMVGTMVGTNRAADVTTRLAVLARFGLVVAYIVALAVVASGAVALTRGGSLWSLGLLWLGPVLLLAHLSLLLSLLARPVAGATGACGLCLVHAVAVLIGGESALSAIGLVARVLWGTNPLVLALSGVMMLGAIAYAPHATRSTP